MKATRLPGQVLLLVFCFGLAEAQNLVEVAKREKERRESLKGQRVLVVTNEDLAKLRKTPALVMSTGPAPDESPATRAGEEDRSADSAARRIMPRISEPGPLLVGIGSADVKDLGGENPEERLAQVREKIGSLISRLNMLREETLRPEAEASREILLRQIDELTAELLKAQQEEDSLKRLIEERKKALREKGESTLRSASKDNVDR